MGDDSLKRLVIDYTTCTTCKEHKPPTAFVKNKSKKNGIDRECRRCRHLRENTKEAREQRRERELQRRYGLSLREYEIIKLEQGNLCACCGEPETATNKFGETLPLSCDHSHITGKVRGLTCRACNLGMGKLRDSPRGVLNAFLYLFEATYE